MSDVQRPVPAGKKYTSGLSSDRRPQDRHYISAGLTEGAALNRQYTSRRLTEVGAVDLQQSTSARVTQVGAPDLQSTSARVTQVGAPDRQYTSRRATEVGALDRQFTSRSPAVGVPDRQYTSRSTEVRALDRQYTADAEARLRLPDWQYISGREAGFALWARPVMPMVGFLALAAAVLSGCAGELPPPVLRAITPASFDEGRTPALLVEVEAVLPFRADHDGQQVELDERLRLRIGESEVEAPLAVAPGQWQVVAPFDLRAGVHDAVVTLGDGRSASLAGAVQVREVVLPDGFTIDPIGPQRRGVPFAVTIRATGAAAPAFTGSVRISTNRGTVTPELSDPFVGGVLTQSVTLGQVGNDNVISIEGPRGLVASSNPFRVNP